MKRILILFLVTSFTGFISCELKEELFDTIGPETFYKTERDAQAAINGAYAFIAPMYKRDGIAAILYSADDITYNSKSGNEAIIAEKRGDPSTLYFKTIWDNSYAVINNANLALKYVPNIDMDPNTKNRILGEAYFLRGYMYFNLVRFFGGVPIKTKSTEDTDNLHQPRSSVEDIYKQIFDDLKKASDMMPEFSEQPESEFGRATKGAAKSILALAYLTHEDWAQAEQYADEVINSGEYSLVTDFGRLWDVKQERQNYQEIIFAVQYVRDNLVSFLPSVGSDIVYRCIPNTAEGYTGHPAHGSGTGVLQVHPWFYDFCTTGQYSGDYRAEKSFLTVWKAWDEADPDGYKRSYPDTLGAQTEPFPYIAKYIDPDGLDHRNHENDLIIIRFAEILLIKAEAENELNNGPTPEAYAAFNQVRSRARNAGDSIRVTPPDLALGLSKEEFRQAIFNERGVEFLGEGHRYFDLLRMKHSSGKTMYEYMLNEYLPTLPDDKKRSEHLIYNSRNHLLPIPLEEIQTNSAIGNENQNPGY